MTDDIDAAGDASESEADAHADELAWETHDTEIDYRCPGFSVRQDDVTLPDGTETDYHYVEEVETVVVLPFLSDGDEVVMIEEWRQAVGRVNRGLPAGGVEPEEDDLERAARRELREETGYTAETVEHLCTTEPVNGVANSIHHTLVARGCEPAAEQDLDHNESIRALTADYDDLVAAVRDGEIRDGRTTLAVSRHELD
ncbi:NUDIX hydrolase [Halolamina salifodinae]|uniref:ADP-ribose pyrophosphatase n=1 Tax=Halolamina salifodinae TaxID=1202767 RepID=A0A8T4GXT8_9EURY|nr:NUDIX hydrolase [Halolamina salifodinae]MBP1987881.1 ADP-ribose pyrophosphatase [Halolamina salifodinae]